MSDSARGAQDALVARLFEVALRDEAATGATGPRSGGSSSGPAPSTGS